jgi:hypothetical protein
MQFTQTPWQSWGTEEKMKTMFVLAFVLAVLVAVPMVAEAYDPAMKEAYACYNAGYRDLVSCRGGGYGGYGYGQHYGGGAGIGIAGAGTAAGTAAIGAGTGALLCRERDRSACAALGVGIGLLVGAEMERARAEAAARAIAAQQAAAAAAVAAPRETCQWMYDSAGNQWWACQGTSARTHPTGPPQAVLPPPSRY